MRRNSDLALAPFGRGRRLTAVRGYAALCLALVLACGSLGCRTTRATVFAVTGAVAVGAGATGLALKGGTHLPVAPLSILGVLAGGVLLIFSALDGFSIPVR